MVVEIRRGSARFTERVPGRLTRHSFSFGEHYDPDRLAWGPMVCHDDHLLGRGEGFERHRHSGLVIVSVVLDGALRHRGEDAAGALRERVLVAGDVGVLHAGAGTAHAEHATDDGPCRFVQVWLHSDDVAPARHDHLPAATGVDVPQGRLDVTRLGAGERLVLPPAPRTHAFVATGALLRSSLAEPLTAGDAMLLDDEGEHEVVAAVPTTVLRWRLGPQQEATHPDR